MNSLDQICTCADYKNYIIPAAWLTAVYRTSSVVKQIKNSQTLNFSDKRICKNVNLGIYEIR